MRPLRLREEKTPCPAVRVFSGFIKTLSEEVEEIAGIFNVQVKELYELIPKFGKKLAGDGKYIDS